MPTCQKTSTWQTPYTPSDQPDAGLTSIWQSKNSPNQRTWLVYTPIFKPILVKPAFVARNQRTEMMNMTSIQTFPSWDLWDTHAVHCTYKHTWCQRTHTLRVNMMPTHPSNSAYSQIIKSCHICYSNENASRTSSIQRLWKYIREFPLKHILKYYTKRARAMRVVIHSILVLRPSAFGKGESYLW